MGLKGICRFFSQRLFEIFVAVVLILLMPSLPPYTNFSQPFKVTPIKPFEGKLALNERLNDAEIWHKGDLHGPEAFAEYKGELYTSLYGGDVVKLTGNHITPIVKTGKPCKGHHQERICGRPLGLQFDKNGIMYVADAYYGIFKVNVETGEKTLLISVDQEINGKKPKLPNSIALASNGDVYWSDSSSEFSLEDGVFDFLADPSGRLIHYDAKAKVNKVLIDKVHFANGVILSDDEEFVLVGETAMNRIHRYYLKGPKKGTHDLFVDGLPGLVDNLKSDGKGGFLVPLVISVDKDHPLPFQVIGPFPLVRKLVGRLFGLTELLFDVINRVYPCEFAEKAVHFIGHFTSVTGVLSTPRVTVVRLDKSGQIVDSIHGLNKKIGHICEAFVYKDKLYLGSPFNDYIARIPLSKIGWEDMASTISPPTTTAKPSTTRPPTTTSRPSTTTPPPTTTTPRPTTTTTRPTTTPLPTTTTTTTPPTTTTPRPTSTIPKQTPPPIQQTAPPKQQDTPPSQQTPPPKQQTPPLKQTTVPKQQTPPPKQQTPPPKQQTPPPKQQTPPSKQQTPPLKQQAPSPKQQSPPPKQEAPPPKQQTPSPKQQTPPQKQQTPPPKQQSPPTSQSSKESGTPLPVTQPAGDQAKPTPVKEQTAKKNV